MAFWDNVKSIAIKAKCTVGWHEGEYKHIDGKPECYFGKTCPDLINGLQKKGMSFRIGNIQHITLVMQ